MKSPAKIQLSALEMELVKNAGWILTKNEILQKAKHLFETLQAKQQLFQQSAPACLPAVIMKTLPKISKGENYRGLPYLVLDHPRYFDKENIFAIRTLFWWGNFFSITLHLSGVYKTDLEDRIINAYSFLRRNNFSYCVHHSQWEHHFEKDNYISIGSLDKKEWEILIRNRAFIKLAQKIPLESWTDVPKILLTRYRQIITMLNT